jgi:hypothetical protein
MRKWLPAAFGFVFFIVGNSSSQTLDQGAHPLAPPIRIPHSVLFDTSKFHALVSPDERKLEGAVRQLLRVAEMHHDSLISPPPSPLDFQSWAHTDQSGKIYVDLRVKKSYKPFSAIDSLLRLSPPVYPVAFEPHMHLIPVWLTPSQIKIVMRWENLQHIRLVTKPHHNTGAIMSEGVSRIRADYLAQIWPNATGAGVRVGILSDDCGSQPADVAPGGGQTVLNSQLSELSPNPLILDDSFNGERTHEGLAMMEIVSDVAPGAPLAFATAGSTIPEFATNIRKLADNGCGVICDDYTFFEEGFFQDDDLSSAIDYAVNQKNAVYVTAAGNYAQFVQTQMFKPTPITLHYGSVDSTFTAHSFGTYSNPAIQSLNIPAGTTFDIALQWSDDFTAPTHDYELFLIDANNNVVTYANSMQYGANGPVALERILYTNQTDTNQQMGLLIISDDPPGTKPAMLKLVAFSALKGPYPAYANGVSSVLGHAISENAITCGAIYALSSAAQGSYCYAESYSSKGPAYVVSSQANTLAVRGKPDVVSMDGVSTGVYTFGMFTGTSAAAPHVAGIAALVKGMFPSLTPAQITTAIEWGAMNFGDTVTYGHGRADAFRTIAILDAATDTAHKAARFVGTSSLSANKTVATSSVTIDKPVTIGEIFVAITLEGYDGSQPLAISLAKGSERTVQLANIDPGKGPFWGQNPNIVLGDNATASVQVNAPVQETGMASPIMVGYYKPANPISATSGFGGMNAKDTWTLTVTSPPTAANISIKNWGIYIR